MRAIQICMSWRSVAFDWNKVRAFLVTVEEGSFSAAARALRMSQPTLSRQVTALEEELSVTLFERTGKGLVLTPTGQELVEHVRAMGNAAQWISLVATGRSERLEGVVRITASDSVAAWVLPRVLRSLRRSAPGIDIEIVAANDIRDLLRREADIAIRHVRPTQSEVVAKLIRETTAHVYGTPELLDALDRPRTLADLTKFSWVGTGRAEAFVPMLNEIGYPLEPHHFRLTSDSTVAVWEMVRAGLGLTFMSRDIADLFNDVEEVLPGVAPPFPVPIWLATHRELRTSARIRTVFDHLEKLLRRAPKDMFKT